MTSGFGPWGPPTSHPLPPTDSAQMIVSVLPQLQLLLNHDRGRGPGPLPAVGSLRLRRSVGGGAESFEGASPQPF